jgi:hypothetical protein
MAKKRRKQQQQPAPTTPLEEEQAPKHLNAHAGEFELDLHPAMEEEFREWEKANPEKVKYPDDDMVGEADPGNENPQSFKTPHLSVSDGTPLDDILDDEEPADEPDDDQESDGEQPDLDEIDKLLAGDEHPSESEQAPQFNDIETATKSYREAQAAMTRANQARSQAEADAARARAELEALQAQMQQFQQQQYQQWQQPEMPSSEEMTQLLLSNPSAYDAKMREIIQSQTAATEQRIYQAIQQQAQNHTLLKAMDAHFEKKYAALKPFEGIIQNESTRLIQGMQSRAQTGALTAQDYEILGLGPDALVDRIVKMAAPKIQEIRKHTTAGMQRNTESRQKLTGSEAVTPKSVVRKKKDDENAEITAEEYHKQLMAERELRENEHMI